MRLARLELTNFRCFPGASIDLSAPVVMLFGPNASGKSSLGDSIEWCLTGRTRGTDDRGAGSKNLIRTGTDGMQVRVIFEDGTYQARALSMGGTVKADPPDAKMDKALVRALVNGASFLDLAHADAKTLLMGVLDVHVQVGSESLTLAQVESRYQLVFEARRNMKAALNAISVPPAPTGEVPDVEAIDKKLADLRAKEHALVAAEARTGGKRDQLDRDVLKATRAVEAAAKALADAKIPADLDVKLGTANALAPEEPAPATLLDNPPPVDLATMRGKVAQLTSNIAYVGKHSPDAGCVLCADIPCKTPSKAFSSQVAALTGELAEAKKTIATAEYQARVLVEREKIVQERNAALVSLQAAVERRQSLSTRLEEAEAELARVTAERDATPADVGPSPELVTLRQRIASGEHISHEAREVIRQRIAHEDATKAKMAAAEKLQFLEKEVDLYGPKGLRVKALADSLGAFEASINAALDHFGYSLTIQPDPWGVIVNGRDAGLLSTSERMRVGLAFSCALASTLGLGFVLLDGADLLDESGRACLASVIDAWNDLGGQILVTATRGEAIPSDENRKCYWLEGGTITAV